MSPYAKAVDDFPRLRQSILATFDNCGLQADFDLRYRQGWSGHRAAGGTLLHRAIAKCLEVMQASDEGEIPVDVAMEIWDEVIRQADVPMTSSGLGDADVPVPARERAEMRVALRSWARWARWKPDDIVGVEKRLDAVLYYPDGAGGMVERVFTTQLDLLEIDESGERAITWDWKSSWQLPPERKPPVDGEPEKGNASDDGYFQQRAHALVVFQNFPRIQRVEAHEFYPRYASGKTVNPDRSTPFFRHDLSVLEADFAAQVERFDRAYTEQVWRPSPGAHCSYCPAPLECTIFPKVRGDGAITSKEEAQAVLERTIVLAAILKQERAKLKVAGEHFGEFNVASAKGRKVYGPVVRKTTKAPTPDEVRAAVARGEDPGALWKTTESPSFTIHSATEKHPHVAEVDAEMKRTATA